MRFELISREVRDHGKVERACLTGGRGRRTLKSLDILWTKQNQFVDHTEPVDSL